MEYLRKNEWMKICSVALNSPIEKVDCTIKKVNTTAGYMGEYYLAAVDARGKNKSPQTLNFFLKVYPKTLDSQKNIVDDIKCFQKEAEVISSLFPEIMSALQDEGKTMNWTCKSFLIRPDLIVLEDLFARGCATLGYREPIDYKHMKVTMTSLANMHAASVIYEESRDKQPYRLDLAYPSLKAETFYRNIPNHPSKQCLQASIDVFLVLLEQIRGKRILEMVKHKIQETMNQIFELQKPSKKFRNVLCHGDLKRDNIFFHYENGQPFEAILVDFQVVRYAPPANDIMMVLYLTTNRKFREKYSSNLLRHYYNNFSYNIKQYYLNVDKVMSWDVFLESCKFYKILGLINVVLYLSFLFIKPESISHVFTSSEEYERFFLKNRIPEAMLAYQTDDTFKEIVADIIDEFIEECVGHSIDHNRK